MKRMQNSICLVNSRILYSIVSKLVYMKCSSTIGENCHFEYKPLPVKEFPIHKDNASIRSVIVLSSQGRLLMSVFNCSCQLSLSNLDCFSNLATCFGNLKMKL